MLFYCIFSISLAENAGFGPKNDIVFFIFDFSALFGQENSAPKMRVKRENVLCCTCPVPRKVVYQPRTVVPIDKYMEMLGRKGTPPPPPPPLPITPPPMVFPMTSASKKIFKEKLKRPSSSRTLNYFLETFEIYLNH